MKYIFSCLFALSLCFFFSFTIPSASEQTKIHIVIDPGHGGNDSGACAVYDGKDVLEKDINRKTALYLGSFLEEYEGITVSYTRKDDRAVDLLQRTEIAKKENADLLISIHYNAVGTAIDYDHGSTVLTGRGVYEKKICQEEQKLACNLLYELSKIGIENQGILLRQSETGSVYNNGKLADYYAIIRNGLEAKIPSVLIEHAFIDSKTDYEKFLSTDKKLKRNALADARGIARYFGLKKKGDSKKLDSLKNVKEKLTLITDGEKGNHKIFNQMYYIEQEESKNEEIEKRVIQKKDITFFENLMSIMKKWLKS